MASLQKGSVLVLVLVVAAFPILGQLAPGMESQAAVGQRTPVPLPEGRGLSDEELLDTEGEFFWFFFASVMLGAAGGATGGTIYAQWFDEDRGIDADDRHDDIAGGAAIGATAGGFGSLHFFIK